MNRRVCMCVNVYMLKSAGVPPPLCVLIHAGVPPLCVCVFKDLHVDTCRGTSLVCVKVYMLRYTDCKGTFLMCVKVYMLIHEGVPPSCVWRFTC